jgi:hypothetical protein
VKAVVVVDAAASGWLVLARRVVPVERMAAAVVAAERPTSQALVVSAVPVGTVPSM